MTSDTRRLDRWKDLRYFSRTLIGSPSNAVQKFVNELPQHGNSDHSPRLSITSILEICKELVFDTEGGKLALHFIAMGISADSLQMCVTHLLSTVDLDEDGAIEILALAHIYEVPVLPNRAVDEEMLLSLYSRLYDEGFWMAEGEGKRRLKLTRKVAAPEGLLTDEGFLSGLTLSRLQPPALLVAARRLAEERDRESKRARRFLREIETGIDALRSVLARPHTEEDLQTCLTSNPILFGPDIRRVVSKPSLGSDYNLIFP